MYSAFSSALAGADPASGALIIIIGDPRAGSAAKRTVALSIKGIYRHLIKCQVLPDLPLLPDKYRVKLY